MKPGDLAQMLSSFPSIRTLTLSEVMTESGSALEDYSSAIADTCRHLEEFVLVAPHTIYDLDSTPPEAELRGHIQIRRDVNGALIQKRV